MSRFRLAEDFNTDDVGSYTPCAGVMPSQRKIPCSKGPDIDSILKSLDEEDILKEVSKHPVAQRKALLSQLRKQRRER